MTNKDELFEFMHLHAEATGNSGVSTQYLANSTGYLRSNVSSLLNALVKEGKLRKTNGRPVLYHLAEDKTESDAQCFELLIGYDNSLRRAVQLAKAALIYPQGSLNTTILGEPGTGKSFMAMIMHRYATSSNIMPADAPFSVYNCKQYQGEDERLLQELFGENLLRGVYAEMQDGVLLIDNAHLLGLGTRNKLSKAIEQDQNHNTRKASQKKPVVIITCDIQNRSACDEYSRKMPIQIELPPLSERPMDERIALIQSFFTLEAARAKKTIVINAELLRCLLLYESDLNIKQLKMDIQRGCAMGYLRERGPQHYKLNLFMSDFEPHVRKGFLHYQDHREEIEKIIPRDYDYAFSESTMRMSAIDKAKLKSTNTYSEIDRKAEALLQRGLTKSEVDMLLVAESETIIREYWQRISNQVVNKEQLLSIVDSRTIGLVEDFINEVSKALLEKFSPSVFYGLCLHVDSIAKGNKSEYFISNEQITNLVENHKSKYAFSLQFASQIEQTFQIKLPVEEAFFIAKFLCFKDLSMDLSKKPVVLFAFMGNGIAAGLSDLINQLVKEQNTFSFEIPVNYDAKETYQALSDLITRIDQGKGVVVLYDMDFLGNMLETINLENESEIRLVKMPLVSLGMEWARKAMISENVDTLYQSMLPNMDQYREQLRRVIVTLCTTGMGGAEELRKYIEQYGDIQGMNVVALSMSDHEQLRESLQQIQKKNIIHCIIGIEDPKLFAIPFISIGEVLSAAPQALPEILRFKNRKKSRIDFDEVFGYLSEQLKHVNTKKLQRLLPEVIEKINEEVMQMSLDTEIGLLMHIASCINRMLGKEPLPQNLRKKQIIATHQDCYKRLLKILKPLERSFEVLFTDDELANIIMIINKL